MEHRIGIVGTGGVAKSHFAGYKLVLGDRATVVAGCDPDTEVLNAYCDERDIRYRFSDAKSLIDSGEIDVLVLLTAPNVRKEYIYPALESGIHVLVEKPFGNSFSECRGYVEAAEKSSAKLAVSQNLRFYPEMEWAQKRVAAGDLGEITYIAQDHFQWRMQTRGWRRNEIRLEIAIFSIHILDRIRWVAGLAPTKISALTRKTWEENGPVGEIFSDVRIEFENGAIGHMTSSWYSRAVENRMRVDGTEASLVTTSRSAVDDNSTGFIEFKSGDTSEQGFYRENAGKKAFGYSLHHFLDAIDNGAEPIHSGKDNLNTMIIVDGAYLSAQRGGEPVTAEEICEP